MNARAVLMEIVRRYPARLQWLLAALFAIPAFIGLTMSGPRPASSEFAEKPLLAVAGPMTALVGIWCLVMLSAMPLWRDARATVLPSFRRPFVQALLVLLLGTIVLPAFALGARWNAIALTLAQLACAACAGALLPILPARLWLFALWAGVIDLAWRMVWPHVPALARWQRALPAAGEASWGVGGWAIACLALALLLAWRWRVVQGDGAAPRPNPFRFMFDRIARKGASYEHLLASAGPNRPVTAMRFLLGGPFMPWDVGLLARKLSMEVPAWVVLAWMLWKDANSLATNLTLVLAIMSIRVVDVGHRHTQRLRELRDLRGDDLAELALLPAWHGPDGARGTLLAIMVATFARQVAVALPCWLVAAWISGAGALSMTLAATGLGVTLLFRLASCLQVLADIDDGRFSVRALEVLLPCALFLTVMVVLQQPMRSWTAMVLMGWLACSPLAGIAALRAWRILQARAHPFLASRLPAAGASKPARRLAAAFDID